MGCVVYEALKTLNLNEAKWAMERVILWADGSLAHFDHTITEIGDTRQYRFFMDGWAFYDVVLSPTITGGRWGYSLKLIPATDGQNSERLAAYKKAVMQLPEWQRELYSELPDFTHIAQQLDMRLQQEWGGLATAKRDSAADVPDGLPEELHELWRSMYFQREAARLSVAFEKADKDWHAAEDKAIALPAKDSPDSTVNTENEREPISVLAMRLNRHPRRVARWFRIIDDYLPKGLTQEQIAGKEERNVETIKDDYRDMKKAGLFPLPHSHP